MSEASRARIAVFTRTVGYRHDSIEAGVEALAALGRADGYDVEPTEDPDALVALLPRVHAVVFLNTSGEVLAPAAQAAFERFVRDGGGFVGVHAACDTGYEWPFYGALVGAYFERHPPEVSLATVRVVDPAHPATRALPATWSRRDEWYDFRVSPRGRAGLRVLAVVDESSYAGGAMGADHPIAWCHENAGGRAFYTGLGHPAEGFAEPLYRAHLGGGVRYALGRD
jgi:type 1 glutamine amidotransferase